MGLVSSSGKTLVTERPADEGKDYGFTIWDVATQ